MAGAPRRERCCQRSKHAPCLDDTPESPPSTTTSPPSDGRKKRADRLPRVCGSEMQFKREKAGEGHYETEFQSIPENML